ncbi:hypothetical protein HU200_057367 [Digitaria exilis]|uniref:Uncharacterized protein n=1 Tax=Digitaria exilis TaxID=1010633 RepID=A0A835E2U7_9POAL|nr:hypothetical protein HU200_057367 [Digitaria exilis]CAB3467518.1 unnamed protein product [Digitaria exilis]
MALGAEMARRPLPAASGDEEIGSDWAAKAVFLAAEKDRAPVDPTIWGDEKRMKRELVAWAKAVASMAASNKNASRSPPPPSSMRRRRMA